MDLICRCLVSVMSMMCGSGWVVSMFCSSMMVVHISRVLRVRALRLWCVKMGFVGGNIGGGVVCGLSRVGYLGTWEWEGAGVSWGVAWGRLGLSSLFGGVVWYCRV